MTSSNDSPPTHTDETLLTYRTMLRTIRQLRRSVNAVLRDNQLTGAQFSLLSAIPPEGIPLTHLASLSWADPGNVSGTVDRLEDAGLVERQRVKGDRRVVLIHLSETGRKLVKKLLPEYEKAVADAFEAWDPEDMQYVRELLAKIKINEGR